MLPSPLHPAVVHFPLVLALVLPLVVIVTLWRLRRTPPAPRTWLVPLVVASALAASSYVAVRSGSAGEDRVEAAVPEAALHAHEEAGERFLVLGAVLLGVAVIGLFRGPLGTAARVVTLAGSVVVAVAAVQVGAAGGELVYRHNAASVYASAGAGAAPARAEPDHDDD